MAQTSTPKVLIFGLGPTGAEALRILIDDDADIQGVFTRRSHVGKDAGEAIGTAPIGLKVTAVSDFRPQDYSADVALFLTTSGLADLHTQAKACLEAGINVVTIAETALYPWRANPEDAQALHEAALRGGASLIATGVNDAAMVRLPVEVAGMIPGVTRIQMVGTGDFAQFGPELLDALQIGVAPEKYDYAAIDEAGAITLHCALAIAELTGLDVESTKVSLEATVSQSLIELTGIGRQLEPGLVSGAIEKAVVQTVQGIEIEVNLVGKCFEPGEEEYADATVESRYLDEPVSLKLNPMPGVLATVGIALNRIQDAIAAKPGFLHPNEIGQVHYSARTAVPAAQH